MISSRTAKLKEKGYSDGLNCIMQYQDSICKNTERYNAEVYAGNDCIPITSSSTNLSMIDCVKLLESNK